CEKAASLLGVDLLVVVSPEALPQALERLEASGEDGAELVKRTRHVVTEIQRTKDLVALLSDGQALAGDKLAEVGTL
nr:hypothetical protein [Streptococcus anginosus]